MGSGLSSLGIGIAILTSGLINDKLLPSLLAMIVGYILIFWGGSNINKEWTKMVKMIEEIKKQSKKEE